MPMEAWWSASVWLVVFVGPEPVEEVESVVLLRAAEAEWDPAFDRALEVGRSLERSYLNEDGQQVSWRLGGVRTLDQIGAEIPEGREVFFTARPVASSGLRVNDLRPEETRPTQTGV